MGYCLMQTGGYVQAIDYLSKSAQENDTMGQNSLYYLGYCYLLQKDTTLAKSSYKAAGDMSFDKTIQEESMWN